MSNFKTILVTFAALSVSLWILAFGADWLHPRLACMEAEKAYWKDRGDAYRFERVSSYFWSSLCREPTRPLIISASEGTGNLSFAQEARNNGILANEITGAHRGLKSLVYLINSKPHSERLEHLHLLAFINPVYFSFAARTDASSVSLTAISNASYFSRIRSFHQKWDEFLLSSLFIGAKSYFEELMLFRNRQPMNIRESWPVTKPLSDDLYDFERNMRKKVTGNYPSFTSKFSANVQPARYLMQQVVTFANAHPDASICYVMLPVNLQNLKFFGRDTEQIKADMASLMAGIPEASRLNLEFMDYERYVFQDPMHLTSWGIHRVMEEVLKTSCGEKVFGKNRL